MRVEADRQATQLKAFGRKREGREGSGKQMGKRNRGIQMLSTDDPAQAWRGERQLSGEFERPETTEVESYHSYVCEADLERLR